MQMIPWWCGSYPEAWEKIVDNWFMEGYASTHNAARERRLEMQGPAHHQDSCNLAGYRDAWVHEFIYLF